MLSLCFLIVLGTLTMIIGSSVVDTYADDWQTPCVLTDAQKATMSSLTGLPVTSVAAEIVACRTYGSDVLLVRYTDGRMGTFGIGTAEGWIESSLTLGNKSLSRRGGGGLR